MNRVRHVHELLTREVWPHESAEESKLYPSLNRVLGGTDPTAPMSRATPRSPSRSPAGPANRRYRRPRPRRRRHRRPARLLYGLHAILRLHTAQEDETYLSLADTADDRPSRCLSPGSGRGQARDRRPECPAGSLTAVLDVRVSQRT